MAHCKRLSCRNSGAILGGNEDLLMEILSVPIKPLMRFKLVSKQWRSLISAASFHHLHTLRHRHRPEQPPPFLLCSVKSEFFYFYATSKKLERFDFGFPHVKIMQSCNGLLLVECRNSKYGKETYYIYNPTTMRHRNLSIHRPFSGLCLSFDPMKSPHFKVTLFTNDGIIGSKYRFSVYVYESETTKWTHKGKHCTNILQFHKGVYWNDGVYFIRPRGKSFCIDLENVQNDFAKPIKSPPRVCTNSGQMIKNYAMESNGYLHSISLKLSRENNYLYVFELNKDDPTWFSKYDFDLNPIMENGLVGAVLGIIRAEKREDAMLLFHVPGKIILHKFYDKSREMFIDLKGEDYYEEGRVQFEFKNSYQCIETLALV